MKWESGKFGRHYHISKTDDGHVIVKDQAHFDTSRDVSLVDCHADGMCCWNIHYTLDNSGFIARVDLCIAILDLIELPHPTFLLKQR
jgi:hypothetical protein